MMYIPFQVNIFQQGIFLIVQYKYVKSCSFTAMGFPVRTKGTGNTEHMFSQWGLVGTGNREQGTR